MTFLNQSLVRSCLAMILIWTLSVIVAGCRTPGTYRVDVDQSAYRIISQKQEQLLGKKSHFNIERPSDILRRQLFENASLPHTGPASLGTDKLSHVEHWPEDAYPKAISSRKEPLFPLSSPLKISLVKALEIGAKNSFEFQTQKETVFQVALSLYLEQESFRNSFLGQIQNLVSSDASGDSTIQGTQSNSKLTGTRQLENGMKLTVALAADIATLLSNSSNSSFGITGNVSLSIPLLRGSGRHIITEPRLQAERNLVYAILGFERFKKEFAVLVGSDYLTILKQLDIVKNVQEDYRSRVVSVRRSKRLADAGRLKEIEVDQSLQNEFDAWQRLISVKAQYKQQMDSFKYLLGLPPDADINLDPDELKRLSDITQTNPMKIDSKTAIELALVNRLDMRVALDKVFDAQRNVVVTADNLGAELTFLGSASAGERRTINTTYLDNATLRTDKGVFSALLTLDLPFERSSEAVIYRNSFIKLEQAVRNVQILEDNVKLSIQNRLRNLIEAKESIYIQGKAVALALKRVKSITLFMDAGRAATRDLLEAQNALLLAQNSLTSVRVDYRIAELEIQRDMGLLTVTDTGLWQVSLPKEQNNAKK